MAYFCKGRNVCAPVPHQKTMNIKTGYYHLPRATVNYFLKMKDYSPCSPWWKLSLFDVITFPLAFKIKPLPDTQIPLHYSWDFQKTPKREVFVVKFRKVRKRWNCSANAIGIFWFDITLLGWLPHGEKPGQAREVQVWQQYVTFKKLVLDMLLIAVTFSYCFIITFYNPWYHCSSSR